MNNNNENYVDEINKKIGVFFENKEYKKALIELEKFSDKKNPIYFYYLALIKDKLNEKKEALEILNKLTNNNPEFLDAFHLLASINEDLKQYKKSRNILELLNNKEPNNPKTKYNLARLYEYFFNNKKEALKLYKEALKIDQENHQIWDAVANIQIKLRNFNDAINTLKYITKKFPDNFLNIKQLAETCLELGMVDSSEDLILKAIKLNSNQNILSLLALCYFRQFRLLDTEKVLKKIIKYRLYNIDEDIAYKRLLLLKVYQHDKDHKVLLPILNKYNNDLGNRKKNQKLKILKKKNKKIRIGFVSCDFRKQSINNVIHALFINKNKKKFEFYCYSSNDYEDKITMWYKNISDSWKNISLLNDIQASKLITSDNIDILIFLGGYFGENRYLLSTYRSSPIQIVFHPVSTSYNKEIDYWISDKELHPLNFKEKVSEKIVRIKSLFNFTKPEYKFLPKINDLPMKKNKYVSFSSFNNPTKISNKCLELWSQVLVSFNNSKLYLRYHNEYRNKKIKNKIYKIFEKRNIKKERIVFIDGDEKKTYLEYYNKIDVGLDTFPYSGATTTFAALCMGVPVLTLTGKNYISRQSASILSVVGLQNWIVREENQYIKKLKKLINLKNIYRIRLNLRKQITESPLCDGKDFTKNFENSMKNLLNE